MNLGIILFSMAAGASLYHIYLDIKNRLVHTKLDTPVNNVSPEEIAEITNTFLILTKTVEIMGETLSEIQGKIDPDNKLSADRWCDEAVKLAQLILEKENKEKKNEKKNNEN